MKKILLILLMNIIFMQVTTDLSFQTSRSISMAGAVVSNPGNVESVFYNPAGLINVNSKRILLGKTDYYGLDFIDYSYFAYSQPHEIGNFGISIQQLGTKVSKSHYLSKETSISFSQAFSLIKDRNSTLILGYTFNFLNYWQGNSSGTLGDGSNGLPATTHSNYSIDIGVLSSLRNKVQIGAYIKNISSSSIGKSFLQYLPRKLSIGVTYKPFLKLNTNIVFERLLGEKDIQFRFSFEYMVSDLFTIRSGIQMKPGKLGFGFTYSPKDAINISYALITDPILPITNNLELKVKF